jgi:hypothetical protein
MSDNTKENWQAQILRLTLFTSGLWPNYETLWHDLTGQEPDSDENRARESTRRQTGRVGDRQLETVVTPIRTDVFFAPVFEAGLPATSFGPAEAEIPAFVSLVTPWLDRIARIGQITRVAFGAVLLLPVPDRDTSYKELGRFLQSVNVDPASTKEILYRINRPVSRGVLELNRLTTWTSVIMRKMIGIDFSLGQPLTSVADEVFVRLETDNSTPAERTEPLAADEIVPIFEALVKMALENAARGELP